MPLADRVKREQIVQNEIGVAGDDQRAGDRDFDRRLRLERSDEFLEIDAVQQMIERAEGNGGDHKTDSDAEFVPADAANELRDEARCRDEKLINANRAAKSHSFVTALLRPAARETPLVP